MSFRYISSHELVAKANRQNFDYLFSDDFDIYQVVLNKYNVDTLRENNSGDVQFINKQGSLVTDTHYATEQQFYRGHSGSDSEIELGGGAQDEIAKVYTDIKNNRGACQMILTFINPYSDTMNTQGFIQNMGVMSIPYYTYKEYSTFGGFYDTKTAGVRGLSFIHRDNYVISELQFDLYGLRID